MRFRTRAMLASGLLAAAFLTFAPHASAQEEGDEPEFTQEQIDEIKEEAEAISDQNGGTEFDGHCLEIILDGGSADDCQEAPSPILPETNEIIWGGISFFLLLLLMWKFALPAVKEGMNNRTERIRSDLDSAETAKTEAVGVLDTYKAQLADAKAEAARIIDDARQSADALKKDQESRLQTELAEARARSAADIEAAKAQATADLRGELAELAVGAASAVVNKNLDPAAQSQLIEDYINSVGTN